MCISDGDDCPNSRARKGRGGGEGGGEGERGEWRNLKGRGREC